MALYKGKKQKGAETKRAYNEDYRTTRRSVIIRAAVFAAVLIALFAIGFFVIEPLLEDYYNKVKEAESGSEADPAYGDGSNVVDVDMLFSDAD